MEGSGSAEKAARILRDAFSAIIPEPVPFRDEWTLEVGDPRWIDRICAQARSALGFDYLVDITSVDNLGEDPRFAVVYEIASMRSRQHLRLVTRVPEENPRLPSVTPVWKGADWHEREIWDMMGIRFDDHPDLRRILMWEGYPWHPLRKDFPLAGRATEMPDLAFTEAAPLEGGPFTSDASGPTREHREPRARP